jgi:Fuc2NAc and GlcNAc transferase
MGDSGSIFLGYCFGAFIIYSLMMGEISFLTWLVVFGYYLGDTTTTTIIRTVLGKKWNDAHRSHAYQNLARILDNHSIVTIGVIIYHILWLLPLAVWTVLKPDLASIAVILAFLPSIILAIKFGPLFSME